MNTPQSSFSSPEEKYMKRALQLARYGAGFVSPNPMVGAVIVDPDGKIIGEGWHRRYGGPHAEVNAVNSVAPQDMAKFPLSTIYVTLEPCSHYGKTPPCSLLLIEKGIGRVVVGSPDPFLLVAGRGIKMLREAGIEVIEGFLQKECDDLNRRFITAHTLNRPFIQLKWAQSRDGFIAGISPEGVPMPEKFSTPLSAGLMHRERSVADAILVGTNTVLIDNPGLDTRLRPGNSPIPVTFESSRLHNGLKIMQRDHILLNPAESLEENMHNLYENHKITSLMVEGGARTLSSFIDQNLFDEVRVEISDQTLQAGITAPEIPSGLILKSDQKIGTNTILTFTRK
ncbi:MAG: bifunctional diaminohydroxyphosphoribosylaminopyrimidine deaminase/5-amino-6-(5-phosphoribosylamino)uracil reductase RibD [Muribaculaceae bacterium]|nr:bifunctional diaminohydroxyphosphoribosylaminopyrimidine deaminase/5-amino-6-(5-phosphoribosylamino)uracil reductase RibD [Muribaculaceae bacterium]